MLWVEFLSFPGIQVQQNHAVVDNVDPFLCGLSQLRIIRGKFDFVCGIFHQLIDLSGLQVETKEIVSVGGIWVGVAETWATFVASFSATCVFFVSMGEGVQVKIGEEVVVRVGAGNVGVPVGGEEDIGVGPLQAVG